MGTPDGFVVHLAALAKREDRGALAALRRSVGRAPGEAAEALPHIVPHLPEPPADPGPYFLVAGLFALHPDHSPSAGNLGATFRRLGAHASAEKRFMALLGSHPDELGERLRHAVALARSGKVAIDYRRLLEDVIAWNREGRRVQFAWAQAYWRAEESASPGNETPGETPAGNPAADAAGD